MKPENARRVALASMASRTMGPTVGMVNSRRRPVRPESAAGRRRAGSRLVRAGPRLAGPSWAAYGSWRAYSPGTGVSGQVSPGFGGLAARRPAARSSAAGASTPLGRRSASAVAAR